MVVKRFSGLIFLSCGVERFFARRVKVKWKREGSLVEVGRGCQEDKWIMGPVMGRMTFMRRGLRHRPSAVLEVWRKKFTSIQSALQTKVSVHGETEKHAWQGASVGWRGRTRWV